MHQVIYAATCMLHLSLKSFQFCASIAIHCRYPVDFSMALQTLNSWLYTSESSHVGPDTTTPTAEQDIVNVQAWIEDIY